MSIDTSSDTHRPPPRSFQPRRRALSQRRAAVYQRLRPTLSLSSQGPPLVWNEVFGEVPVGATRRVVLDIGFGGGEALVQLADERPDEAVIGVEVHTPGVASVLAAAEEHGWRHVRVVEDDVLHLLPRIAAGSLDEVRVWFPDPWPKNKQRHRRLLRPDVVGPLVDRLAIGGVLHVATDIDDYARQVVSVAAADGRLVGGAVPRPSWRPLTRYERRGLAAGRVPVDLVYTRSH